MVLLSGKQGMPTLCFEPKLRYVLSSLVGKHVTTAWSECRNLGQQMLALKTSAILDYLHWFLSIGPELPL